ncbi:MAG: alcohol dehydrogenase [Cryptosporangiaceae bacterium]|nr:alcohol dehydrogenase [Cryptosporangiaceae bacterium]
MKALVYHGPGEKTWETVPDPGLLTPTDAIVQVDAVTICGTDLHILKGDVPAVEPGRVLGHEAVGTVVEAGAGVGGFAPGDRVLVSCITGCGRCEYCRSGTYGQCLHGGGWILGHRIDGVQADFVRVPFADNSLHRLPQSIPDDSAVLLADILPTSYEVGVLNGQVRPGDTVVIVGAGPVGLAAVLTARFFSPSRIVVVEPAASRRDLAKRIGADVTLSPDDDPERVVRELTGGLGAHVVMEAVGVPAAFELCTRMVRPNGRLANIGVHGAPVTLHLEDLWIKNVTITTGLVDTVSTPTLLGMLASHQIDAAALITHRFGIGQMLEAYDVFAGAADSGAMKVVLTR